MYFPWARALVYLGAGVGLVSLIYAFHIHDERLARLAAIFESTKCPVDSPGLNFAIT